MILTLVAQHVADWADGLVCDVYPVIEDAAAGAAAKAASGKESWHDGRVFVDHSV